MPPATRASCAALLCALGGCGLGGDVGQQGEYTFLPGAAVTDTAGRPVSQLLRVEEDRPAARARVYLFEGELGEASLGIADLRRLAGDQGRFQMAFEAPTSELGADVPAGGDATRHARAGDDELPLTRLDNDGLAASGADRFVRTLDSQDYRLRAHFGSIELDQGEALPAIAVQDGGPVLEPRLERAALTFALEPEGEAPEPSTQPDGGSGDASGPLRATLRYGELDGADYLVIELAQRIARNEGDVDADSDAGVPDEEIIEAMVRTSLAPGGEYVMSSFLFTDVFGQGCWSRERPVIARLTQVARRYVQTPAGDQIVIHQRVDALELPPERWLGALAEPSPRDYCDRYRTPAD